MKKGYKIAIVLIVAIIGIFMLSRIPAVFMTAVAEIDGFKYDFVYIYKMIGGDPEENPIFQPSLESGDFILSPEPLKFTCQNPEELGLEISGYRCPEPREECWESNTNYGTFIYNDEKEVVDGIKVKFLANGRYRRHCRSVGEGEEKQLICKWYVANDEFTNYFYINLDEDKFSAEFETNATRLHWTKPYKEKIIIKSDIPVTLDGIIEYTLISRTFLRKKEILRQNITINPGENVIEVEIPTDEIQKIDAEFIPSVKFKSGDNEWYIQIGNRLYKTYTVAPKPVGAECILDEECPSGYVCRNYKCVKEEEAEPLVEKLSLWDRIIRWLIRHRLL